MKCFIPNTQHILSLLDEALVTDSISFF